VYFQNLGPHICWYSDMHCQPTLHAISILVAALQVSVVQPVSRQSPNDIYRKESHE